MTAEEYKNQIINTAQAYPQLGANLTSTSKTAIFRLWASAVGIVMATFEAVFNTFKQDVEDTLRAKKPHSLLWYTSKAKDFQLGYSLPNFEDEYDNTLLTEEQVEDSKIVTHASCTKSLRQNGRNYLRLKVAKGTSPTLDKLSTVELTAFDDYMQSICDAGVDLSCESNDADQVVMDWTIYYDPQLIDLDGNSLVTGEPVVVNAIVAYLQNLPFNGRYVPEHHKQYLYDTVPGVVIANINDVRVTIYGTNVVTTPSTGGMVPDAGWMKFYTPSDLTINLEAAP